MKNEVRISVDELLDICGYAISYEAAQVLKKHYARYNNYSRLKQVLIESLIAKNNEFSSLKRENKALRAKMDDAKQMDLFLGHK